MPHPPPRPPAAADSAGAPSGFGASGWSELSGPGELRGSGFNASMRDPAGHERPPATGVGSAFDVCHVGVVLRAVLLVQGVVALGTAYGADSLAGWLLLFARGSIVSLWAVLLWLIAGCALKRSLSRLGDAAQWAVATGLGGASAALGWLLLWFSGLGETAPRLSPAPVASGAAMAAALFYWLRLRARARAPADATARLAELQSRIRPHFLFNTLNSAVALVRLDPARAESVLEDLSELFRVALSETGEAVTLAEEVELARRYLEIEEVRFGPRLRVRWEIDPGTLQARVPPLLLQPLVENAVRHGIERSAAGGTVRLRTRVKGAQAVIDIVNSLGDGPSVPGHGIALRNVRERLHLMHDVAAHFYVRQDAGSFRVQIVLPLKS